MSDMPLFRASVVDATVNYVDDRPAAAASPVGAAGGGDDVMRLRALLRPIISDLLREELRTTMRMRG